MRKGLENIITALILLIATVPLAFVLSNKIIISSNMLGRNYEAPAILVMGKILTKDKVVIIVVSNNAKVIEDNSLRLIYPDNSYVDLSNYNNSKVVIFRYLNRSFIVLNDVNPDSYPVAVEVRNYGIYKIHYT